MTTPTRAEQIARVLVEFHNQLPPTSRLHVDVSRMASALLDARATIARLEGELAMTAKARDIATQREEHFHDQNADLRNENTRLRTRADAAERRVEVLKALVEQAFFEGYGVPHYSRTDHAEKTWRASKVRRALAAASRAADGTATKEG